MGPNRTVGIAPIGAVSMCTGESSNPGHNPETLKGYPPLGCRLPCEHALAHPWLTPTFLIGIGTGGGGPGAMLTELDVIAMLRIPPMDVAARRFGGDNASYRADQQIDGEANHSEGDHGEAHDDLQRLPQLEPHHAGRDDGGAGHHRYRCGNDA
jgi:hypothetical protein